MSQIRDAWRRAEQRRPAHKGKASEVDATPTTASTEKILRDSQEDVSPNYDITETALSQCTATDWEPDPRRMLFFSSEEQAPCQENFRTLRSRLYLLRENTPLSRILVTSSLPKEGKSFVAANLALVMSRQRGCRTLLIDADLRSSSLHSALGTFDAPGLSEYLLGETEEFRIIQKGKVENLFFIPSGRPVSEQSEVIANGRLKLLLDRIGSLFEWVIVDSPAVIPVSDAVVMAGVCDGVLIVVRSNSTPFDIVRKARERFREEHLLGVVLNGIPPELHVENYYLPSMQRRRD